MRNRFPTIATALAVLIAIYLSGVGALVLLDGTIGVSRFLFLTVDIPGFAAGALTALVLAGSLRLANDGAIRALSGLRFERLAIWALVLVTGGLTFVGTNLVYHGFALSMDEWMPNLQARLFEAGTATGQIGADWQDYGRAMFHRFATYDPETGRVASSYRPGMAALIALFDTAGLGAYTSTFLNAGAVALVALVTRQIFPESRSAPVVAAIVLASSQQALAAAMTSYAMPGHLFFNLLWLHLFLRDRPWAHALAALVGVITASLHQVHVHLFFALPFLLTLLRPFRPGIAAIYGGIYLLGHLAVLSWDRVLINQVAGLAGNDTRTTLETVLAIARLPSPSDLASVWANLTRLVGWQNLALVPLLLALWRSGARPRWTGLLLASIATSLLPYLVLMPDQGHGWGYRYLHGLLGHLAILAGIGWHMASAPGVSARYRAFLVSLLLASPLVMLPLRARQIEGFVAPYAAAAEMARSRDADVAIVDSARVFVGVDIPRNDPAHISRPVTMSLNALTPAQIARLCRTYSVEFLSVDDLAPLGLKTIAVDALRDRATYDAQLKALQAPGCRASPE